MNLKKFIDRPVLSMVISIVIIILGVIGLSTLPVERYPDIAPPTVMVMATYPGADAETIQKTVAIPLEESINGVEDMTYITSSTTNSGQCTLRVYFEQGTDADMAAVNVQNRVAKATGLLPSEVNQIGITTMKRQNSILQVISIYSPDGRYDADFLSNYMKINIEPQLLRINGVGEAEVLGPDYSMRIWLNPELMAQYGLVPSDVSAALAEQNVEAATGSFGENSDQTFQYTMKYKGRLLTPEQFGSMVIRANDNGEITYLRDIATIEMGKQQYNLDSETNGQPGIVCMISQTAGSNATQVIRNIEGQLDEVRQDLPEGVEIISLMNSNDFLYASIKSVLWTLVIAIILVVLVVYFFLQNIRATLIPAIAMIVSIVGTFAFMSIAGFSVNLLTLFALVLAIGTVVDNAIVVVEAVQTKFDGGYRSAYRASVDAMSGVSSAILTATLVFMAVFIPVSFMGGTSGVFYTQFGITMAVAVGISAICALTLCPALCALLLRPDKEAGAGGKPNFEQRFRGVFNASFSKLSAHYKKGVTYFIDRKWLTFATLALGLAAAVILMKTTPTGLVPEEDTGSLFVEVNTAAGTSLHQTGIVMTEVEQSIKEIPQIESYAKISGYGITSGRGASYGTFIIKLKNWDVRKGAENNSDAVKEQIMKCTSHIKDARAYVFAPPMIPGYGMGNGFELYLQDRAGGDVDKFYQVSQGFISELQKRPEIASAFSSFNINYPQYQVDVNASRCKRSDISPADVLKTLEGYYGGLYASNFTRFSKVYRVMIQASPEYRMDTESLNNIFVRTPSGMAPISQFVTIKKMYGAETMSRFNLFNSIAVNGAPSAGYSSSDAIAAIEEVANDTLPRGYGYEFGGISREESKGADKTLVIYLICFILTYLILSAMYESFFVPLAVILSIPFGMLGSFFFAKIFGLENNIYLQTGIIMLIGLLAKTAILITEYAETKRKGGLSLRESATEAAGVRLRPVLMTALTMVFGLLPLMFSSGAGANGNRALGTGAIGGMLLGTLALLFIVPSLFTIFQYLQEKIKNTSHDENN